MTSTKALSPARTVLGCVLRVDTGVYEVWTSRGRERATMGGGLLSRVARSEDARPVSGDWVDLRRWRDGRLTMCGRAGAQAHRTHLRLVS